MILLLQFRPIAKVYSSHVGPVRPKTETSNHPKPLFFGRRLSQKCRYLASYLNVSAISRACISGSVKDLTFAVRRNDRPPVPIYVKIVMTGLNLHFH